MKHFIKGILSKNSFMQPGFEHVNAWTHDRDVSEYTTEELPWT